MLSPYRLQYRLPDVGTAMTVLNAYGIKTSVAGEPKSPGFWLGLVACKTLWVIALYVFMLLFAKQLQWQVSEDDLASIKPFGSKVVDFLTSPAQPEIILLGSSMALVPAVACDEEIVRRRKRQENAFVFYNSIITQYSRADYLQNLLSKRLRRSNRVVNIALPTSMVSDHDFIFKQLSEFGKKPRLIIINMSWRDACSKLYPVAEQTPVRGGLGFLHQALITKGERTYLSEIEETIGVLRLQMRKMLSGFVSAMLVDRQKAATDGPLSKQPKRKIVARTETYIPINEKSFSTQLNCIYDLAGAAGRSRSAVLFVDLPVGESYQKPIPKEILKRYYQTLERGCYASGISLLELNKSGLFHADDFEDGCHLNAQGGKKMFTQIAEFIEVNGKLCSAL